MFIKSLRTAVFSLLATTAAAACSSDSGDENGERACTNMGCGPAFQLEWLSMAGAAADVPGMTIEVCRNAECLTGSFAQSTAPQGNQAAAITFPDPLTIDMTGSSHVDAFISEGDATRPGPQLTVHYYSHDSTALTDGDRYTVTVRRGSSVVASFDRSVVYSVSYPNGVACGPECRKAQ